MKHVNPSFSIQAPKINFETADLFAEAGPAGFSIVVLEAGQSFKALAVYTFEAGLQDHELAARFTAIFNSEHLLQKQYSRSHIFWSFPESILVPAELMNADRNENMLNLVFGDARHGLTRSDFVYKHNLHLLYRIPQSTADVFSGFLPFATQTHIFTTMVNQDIPAGDHLFTVFYSNSLTIMLCKAGQLQLIQNFTYNNPDDCVFHLLNVCQGFDVQPEAVVLHINGMIDVRSGLYETIYKYFLQVSFDELPGSYTYHETVHEHPAHFFSHLFALASCV